MKSKKGAIDLSQIIIGVVLVIIAIIVIFQIVGSTAGDLTDAADNISSSGLPLASLFASNGVVLLVFMAFLLIAVILIAMQMSKAAKGGK